MLTKKTRVIQTLIALLISAILRQSTVMVHGNYSSGTKLRVLRQFRHNVSSQLINPAKLCYTFYLGICSREQFRSLRWGSKFTSYTYQLT